MQYRSTVGISGADAIHRRSRQLPVQRAIRDPRAPAYAAPLAAAAPANDNFADRQQLTPPFSPPGAESLPADRVQSTAGASLEAGENAPCGNIGATVWFEFQPDRDLTVEIDTAQSDFDTVLAVYTLANFVPSPPAGASLTPVACDDNSVGAQSRVVVPMSASHTYLVQAGGSGGATGMLHLHADCQPACTPRNDNVNQATNIDTFSMPFQRDAIDRGRDDEARRAARLRQHRRDRLVPRLRLEPARRFRRRRRAAASTPCSLYTARTASCRRLPAASRSRVRRQRRRRAGAAHVRRRRRARRTTSRRAERTARPAS